MPTNSLLTTLLRTTLKAALRGSSEVVVTFHTDSNETWHGGQVGIEVWDVENLKALAGEIVRAHDHKAIGAFNEDDMGRCQEIGLSFLDEIGASPNRCRRIFTHIEKEIINSPFNEPGTPLITSVQMNIGSASIEISKGI